jgi:hypothetical protein
MTLKQHAAAEVRASRCAVCRLPATLRAEVDEILRNRDISKAAMKRARRVCGHPNQIDCQQREWHHQFDDHVESHLRQLR